jgi:hypothetical protein
VVFAAVSGNSAGGVLGVASDTLGFIGTLAVMVAVVLLPAATWHGHRVGHSGAHRPSRP